MQEGEESPIMYAERIGEEQARAEEQQTPKCNRRVSSCRLPWCYRVCLLLVLALFGLHLFTAESDARSGGPLSVRKTASGQTGLVSDQSFPLQVGLGAGATSGGVANVNTPVATCLNPLDATCWLQNAAQWMAQQVKNALQPVIGAIMRNPLNILTQTPPTDTYQNPTVVTWW
jgi:hypothetical protein